MARIRADYVFGTTTAALGAADTTLSSAELSRLPAVTAPDIAAVTLYDGTNYEIVYVTAHTASATTATILRGQEGSTAAAWASGATWQNAPTAQDITRPRCVLKTTLNQTLPNDTAVALQWDQETMDSTGMHSTTTNTDRVNIAVPGMYLVKATVAFNNGSTTGRRLVMVYKNGAMVDIVGITTASTENAYVPITSLQECAAGDYLSIVAQQDSGGSRATVGNLSNATILFEGN